MTDNNNDIRYSISPEDTPKDKHGTPASELRVEAPAQKHAPAPDYGTKTDSGIRQNLTNTDIPPSVLRDQLRDAEIVYKHNHTIRKRKLFWYLFRTFFWIISLFVFLYCVGTFNPETFLEYVGIAAESTITSVIFSLILAAIGRPIHTSAQNACFADEFDELYQIEHIKDRLGQR